MNILQQVVNTNPVPTPMTLKKKVPVLDFVEPEVLSEYLSILIIGAQGVGKTKLTVGILECEQIEGVLYIDADNRGKTAAPLILKYRDKVKVIRINKLDPIGQMKKVMQWLEIATDREKAAEAGILFVDTVVIDSISFLADRVIAKLGGMAEAITGGNTPPKSVTQPEWNQQKIVIEEWISTLREMPCHLIVTCHQHSEKNEKTGVLMPQLILPGKLGKKLPAFFDEVFWLSIEQSKADPKRPDDKPKARRVLLCVAEGNQEDGFREAKDCSETLPATIEGPDITMKKLFSYFFKN